MTLTLTQFFTKSESLNCVDLDIWGEDAQIVLTVFQIHETRLTATELRTSAWVWRLFQNVVH